jgi:pterin-4a-carbinolamine dehydratase
MEHLAFINYRRDDSGPSARRLMDNLGAVFGRSQIFMDTTGIESGTLWADTLDKSLQSASLLLVVIGAHWLFTQDRAGRRRLDLPDDWVRREIETAVQRAIPIMPVLVNDAQQPPTDALPDSIKSLSAYQSFQVRDAHWDDDVDKLVSRLMQLGFRGAEPRIRVPKNPPDARVPIPLSDDDIRAELAKLPGWTRVARSLPGSISVTRDEIYRRYMFASFLDAIDFMVEASKHIEGVQHHPVWENVWITLNVWITTFDVTHKLTRLDFELAAYLDALYVDAGYHLRYQKRRQQ